METISCHSNQNSYPTGIKKNNFCRGQCPKQVCQFSASSSIRFLRRRILNFFFENLLLMLHRQPIKLSHLDKSRMKHGELLTKHICEEKIQISPVRQQKLSISTFPIISLWEL